MASETSLDRVGPEIRGIALAVVLTAGGEPALSLLADPLREPARQAWRALEALADDTRARLLADWRAEATGALPAGFASLHPSWSAEELVGETAPMVDAIRGAAGEARRLSSPTGRELARLAFARLVPLCESEGGPLAQKLAAMAPSDLVVELTRQGARTVGRSLGGARPALLARAMARVGEPWAQEIAAAATAPVTSEERAAAVALAAAAADSERRTAEERLLTVGLAAIKGELAAESSGSLWRVAGRLPASLGRSLIGW